jgi:hypothetical protein
MEKKMGANKSLFSLLPLRGDNYTTCIRIHQNTT